MVINSDKIKQSILIALGDAEMLSVLDACMMRAVSVNDIIKQTGIPHTTAYRKVKWLLDQGLLAVQKIIITKDGKKFSEVRSTLKSFNVRYEMGSVVVEGEENFNPMQRTAQDFFSLEDNSL